MITTLLLLISIVLLDFVNLSVDVLILSIVFLIISYRFPRKTSIDVYIFIVAALIAVASLFVEIEYVRSGLIGFSLLNVVLFTGVLSDKWKVTKNLRLYRGFYSILGVILILPHVSLNLFVDQQINIFGIASIVLMIPLFLTSFNIIKKEMKIEEWIKLQKLSYVVYLFLFIHLISVSQWEGKIVYAVLMTLYINNKIVKEFRK